MKIRYALLSLFLFPVSLFAQKGHFLGIGGGPQLVGLVNADDVRQITVGGGQAGVDRLATYRWAAGLDYYYNFAESYGIQSGVYFSRLGQKYEGLITLDANTGTPGNKLFESHVYMDYLRVPLMVRFSSLIEEDDRMNMTIFAGISFNYFLGVTEVSATPSWPDSMSAKFPDFDYDKLYKKVNMMMGAGAQFNIKANESIYPFFGIRFDRSIGSIENFNSIRNQRFGKGGAPVEWTFPVSAKKAQSTDLLTRSFTKHNVINVFAGVAVKLNGKKAEE